MLFQDDLIPSIRLAIMCYALYIFFSEFEWLQLTAGDDTDDFQYEFNCNYAYLLPQGAAHVDPFMHSKPPPSPQLV